MSRRSYTFLGALSLLAALSPRASALPAFARQLDVQCIQCHTEFPILTDFGRSFKLTGYTASAENTMLPPLAVFLQPSFTRTQADQVGGAAPGFGANNNFAITQASIFYAGRLFGPYASRLFSPDVAAFLNKFGIFGQVTYDGVAKAWSWDNTEIRFANVGEFHENDLITGVVLNNNPGLEDPWNSSPAFAFPFSGSGLAPAPAAGTLIEGALAQQVVGLGFYTMYNDHWYADVSFYRNLSAHYLNSLGVSPDGLTTVSGIAPYWRFAYQTKVGDATWEVGTLGMSAAQYPGGDASQGADHITDVGVDTFYQMSTDHGDFEFMASDIEEYQHWSASQALGSTTNSNDSLNSLKLTATYLRNKTYSFSVQYFLLDGGSDSALYSGSQTGSPTSDGFVFQLAYLPFNRQGGPAFWPRSNVKFSLQYTVYNRFNGARTNYDGMGASANGNNTLYLEAWIVF